ncbi:hypothetical protein [Yinghuangia seranimata]|uniref:hypothetical protein n=1 Tax=Yinghuangia seranimata TaxID=408067 RepID=UPI00248B7FDA|nr:hypothetical protein [Yinghuangia seranimata]MDI2132035.1 hypothetical protein [Yinghuangia seranimata]
MFRVLDVVDRLDDLRKDAQTGAEAEPKAPSAETGVPAKRYIPPIRVVLFLWRMLLNEFRSIVVAPFKEILVNRRWGGLNLAFIACIGVIVLHAIHLTRFGHDFVRIIGGVQASLPLPISLLRTPVSLYVPALNLPVWAGLTQLFIAFALAQLTLGWKRTLVIAYISTLAGTMTARFMISLGPHHMLGLPHSAAYVLDTGPSAAVVGLFSYISVVKRAPVLFSLTGLSMTLESIAVPNLAGREHLIAIGAAMLLGFVRLYRESRGIEAGALGRAAKAVVMRGVTRLTKSSHQRRNLEGQSI